MFLHKKKEGNSITTGTCDVLYLGPELVPLRAPQLRLPLLPAAHARRLPAQRPLGAAQVRPARPPRRLGVLLRQRLLPLEKDEGPLSAAQIATNLNQKISTFVKNTDNLVRLDA